MAGLRMVNVMELKTKKHSMLSAFLGYKKVI